MKYLLGVVLLLLSGLYHTRDALFFDNGNGGADWKIGQPQVSIWTISQSRSLPELRAFGVKLINRDRQLNGLPPLIEDALLSQAAQNHAQDMRQRNYYAHVTPDGKTPTDRLAALGGQGGVAENIMFQAGSLGTVLTWGLVERFQKSWMYSEGHRANLLDPRYTSVGYGIVSDRVTGKVYAVQKFQ